MCSNINSHLFPKDSSQGLNFTGALASEMRFISLKHGGWIQYLCCGTLELNPMGAAALPHHSSSSLGLLFSNFPDHGRPGCSRSAHVFQAEDNLTRFLMKVCVSVSLPANIVSLSLSRVIFKITLGFHYHIFFPVTTWLPRNLSTEPRCRRPHETTSCHIWTDFSS